MGAILLRWPPATPALAPQGMDVVLLLFLIFLNSLFAMSEMALTASRKARLQVMVESGDSGASHAMALHDNPTKWLSVVQIGITSISILNGIVGDAAFSAPFGRWLHETFSMRDRVAEVAATAMVVVTITFLSIVFGELVPKRLGLMYPETIARLVGAADGVAVADRAAVRASAVLVHRGDPEAAGRARRPRRAASPRRRSPPASRKASTPA